MIALALAAALLVSDPSGDVPPPGYAFPRVEVAQQPGAVDLLGFLARDEGGKLVVGFRLAQTPNPAGAPLGFSLAVLAAYVDDRPGGVEVLPGAGFRTPEGEGVDEVILVTGWGAELRTPDGKSVAALKARREGDWIVVPTPLKPKRARYFVVSGLYDPFAPWGFRKAMPQGGIWSPRGPIKGLNALDAVTLQGVEAFTSGILEPARPPPWFTPRRALTLLLAILGGALLAFGVWEGWRYAGRGFEMDL